MALKRCDAGHYFDPDRHSTCPACGVVAIDFPLTRVMAASAAPPPKPRARAKPAGEPAPPPAPKREKPRPPAPPEGEASGDARSAGDLLEALKKRSAREAGPAAPAPAEPAAAPGTVEAPPPPPPARARPALATAPGTKAAAAPAPAKATPPAPAPASDVPTARIADQPTAVPAPVAAPAAEPPGPADPVVGWLVCVEGPDRGADYRLHSERNYLGRGEDMDVRIRRDEAVSPANHAIVSFNPRNRQFKVHPGDSRGIVYLNGQDLDAPAPLAAGDRLELGRTTLVFVPFVGESFQW